MRMFFSKFNQNYLSRAGLRIFPTDNHYTIIELFVEKSEHDRRQVVGIYVESAHELNSAWIQAQAFDFSKKIYTCYSAINKLTFGFILKNSLCAILIHKYFSFSDDLFGRCL